MTSLSARLQAAKSPRRDYTPVPWYQYFDEAHDITFDGPQDDDHWPDANSATSKQSADHFRVYLRNFRHPLAPKRQIGQRSETRNMVDITQNELQEYSRVPTLVMLHGGGYSALTWAQFTHHIEQHCNCRLLAIDLRGHGDTKTSDDDRMDMDTLVADVIKVTHRTHEICGFPETPKCVLIGHSMGGAIAVKCSMRCQESMPSLAGFVVIDVVEGTAKDALPLMMSVIKTRPSKFPSLENAIEWSVRSGMAKNIDAARVSMPGNLLNVSTGYLSIHHIEDESNRMDIGGQRKSVTMSTNNPDNSTDTRRNKPTIRRHKFHISLEKLMKPSTSPTRAKSSASLVPRIAALRKSGDGGPLGLPPLPMRPPTRSDSLNEADEDRPVIIEAKYGGSDKMMVQDDDPINSNTLVKTDDHGYKRPPDLNQSGYCWRTDLARTQPFWSGWFEGLSEQLLNSPVQGKFLLLAGIDRLDRTLTIGQMQGKFMMKVLPKCGHAVHEDVPMQVASVIGQFLVRNKFTTSNSIDIPMSDQINC